MIAATAVQATNDAGVSDLWVAVIAASAALLGAVVGGLVSGWFSLKGEDKRQKFARDEAADREARDIDRDRALARGAARVIAAEFKVARALLRSAAISQAIWPERKLALAELEDRKRVATLLDANEWHSVVTAEVVIRTMAEHRVTLAETVALAGWHPEIQRFMDQGTAACTAAIAALRPLTGGADAAEAEPPAPPA